MFRLLAALLAALLGRFVRSKSPEERAGRAEERNRNLEKDLAAEKDARETERLIGKRQEAIRRESSQRPVCPGQDLFEG
jgi:hypothetical protein